MYIFLGSYLHSNRQSAAIVKCSIQTDFAARTNEAKEFIDFLAKIACGFNTKSIDDLLEVRETPRGSIKDYSNEIQKKLGEKISIIDIWVINNE